VSVTIASGEQPFIASIADFLVEKLFNQDLPLEVINSTFQGLEGIKASFVIVTFNDIIFSLSLDYITIIQDKITFVNKNLFFKSLILKRKKIIFFLTNTLIWYILRYKMRNKEINMKIKEGDMITEGGISYVVEKDEDGTLWGVSNNAEYEIEINEDFCPDSLFSC
jgi:hypothetical protein